jgi:hypothetical protein
LFYFIPVAGGGKEVKSSSPLHVVKASALIWLSVGLLLGKTIIESMQFLHSTSKHPVTGKHLVGPGFFSV